MDDDFTRSVSDAFRDAEPSGAPEADWDDLSGRIERRHRRQRNVLAGCAVVVAMATGVGGYALGNDGGGTLTVKSDSPSTAGGSGSGGAASDGSATSPLIATAPGPISGGVSSSPEFSGYASAKLISRRTAAGLEIRSWRSTFPGGDTISSGVEQNLPDECIPTGTVTFAVVSADDVVQNGVSETKATRPIVTLSAQTGSLGTDPVITIVVTAVDEASVSATFPDGTVDSMSPVDHTVILAASASADDVKNWSRTKIRFTSSDGTNRDVAPDSVNAMMPTDIGTTMPTSPTVPQIDCSPRLPAPGEQPADAAAARDAVISAFTRLYDPNVSDDDKAGLVDDPTGVQDGWSAARTGSFAEAAKNSEFKLVDLVFTAPDQASVKYDILLPTGSTPVGSLTGQIGTAHLVDGTWKVTRGTICGVLAMAGAGCGGDVTSSSGAVDGGVAISGPPIAPAAPVTSVSGGSSE